MKASDMKILFERSFPLHSKHGDAQLWYFDSFPKAKGRQISEVDFKWIQSFLALTCAKFPTTCIDTISYMGKEKSA